ncbi:MAG: methionine adenosyltransferase [Planctomycetes bacterium]|nr:methionine adenosyltransferase [Planctomycetota bacterium]
MNSARRLFSSEAVCMGHPDKIADQISDAVLDKLIEQDPYSRVACETLLKNDMAIVAGEITTNGYVEVSEVVRQTIKEIGYDSGDMGLDYNTCTVLTCIEKQSPDIAMGVDEDKKQHKQLGAGDQGIMFGYACNETAELMPMPIMLARKLVNKAAEVRQDGSLLWLRPDGKSQVTIEYENNKPLRVHTVVLSVQHSPEVEYKTIRKECLEHIIKPVIPANMLDKNTIFHINPTGRFIMGGPKADCGLTGRKIIVDTYGGMGHHGGGCFSGKDPTKVDRSASYAARHAAKNIVAAGLADRCEVQLAYAIGVAEPVSIAVETYGTGKTSETKLIASLRKHFDFTPHGMIEKLHLRKPIYKNTARFGHFGLNRPEYTWEKADKAHLLKKDA